MNILAKLSTIGAIAALMLLSFPLAAQRGRGGGGRAGPPSMTPSMTRSPGHPSSHPGIGTDHRRATTAMQTNPALSQRASTLLPPGADVNAAAANFPNEREFLAALHASRNFDLPFNAVKRKMTEGPGMPLDKSIRALRPDLSKDAVKQGVKDAEHRAKEDLRAASGKSTHRWPEEDSAVAAQIRMNRGWSDRVAPLLPEGMTLSQASAGFRNAGQFVAALHAAKNLEIPFRELRARMIAGGESLGEAIQATRPTMDRREIDAAVRSAEEAARYGANAETAASANVRDRNQ